MGHYGQFGCAQWATAADLVIRYGPLRGIKRTVKSVLIFVIWPIAQDLVMRMGRVWLSPMGRSEGFGSALWAMAQHLILRYGRLHKTNYHSAELDNSFEKLAISFKGTVMLESACI